MKKILSLFAAVLFASSMMAKESVDFAAQGYTNQQAITSYAGTAFSIAFDKGTNSNAPKYYTSGTAIRCYGGNTMTFTATSANITSIVLTFGGSDGTNEISANVGKFEDATWTGDAASVVLTIGGTTGNRRIKAVDVYFAGETPAVVTYDTLNVADAIVETNKLDSGKTSEKKYFVEGFVVNAAQFSPSYNNQTFFLVDDPAAPDSLFQIYGALPKIGDDTVPVVDGDKVRAFGFLQKYVDKNKGNKVQLEMGNPAVEVLDTVPGQDRSLPEIPTISVDSALKIGSALADGGTTTEYYIIEGYVSHIDNFFSEDFKNETFYITDTKGSREFANDKAFYVYRGKPSPATEIGHDAKVSVKCIIKNYGGTIEPKDQNIAVTVLEASTFVPDTLTVEEAVEEALKVSADNAPSEEYFVVKGFVNSVATVFSSKYNNATFTMAQFPNEAEGVLKAYQANILKADSNKVKTQGAAPADLYVNVLGYLTKYQNAAQIVKGSHVAFVEAPNMDTIRVDAATALADGLALAVGAKSDRIYAVTDIVSSAEDEDEGLQSFSMADDFFEAYLAHVEEPIAAGNKVEVVGRLKNVDDIVVQIEGGKARIIYPEGIENIELTEKAQKVVVDGAVYIIRDNKMFNIHGAQVR